MNEIDEQAYLDNMCLYIVVNLHRFITIEVFFNSFLKVQQQNHEKRPKSVLFIRTLARHLLWRHTELYSSINGCEWNQPRSAMAFWAYKSSAWILSDHNKCVPKMLRVQILFNFTLIFPKKNLNNFLHFSNYQIRNWKKNNQIVQNRINKFKRTEMF